MHVLGDISIETFLSEYWQKKPLLIRNAFPNFESPIDPDDLAGLSLEEDVESRIIKEKDENGPWQLYNGPFTEETFETLPEEKWTLLVQAVDQWVPEAADLLDLFSFIPSWRLDDIMASFAPKGGSVGPHFDQYDVFLLQAEGQRHWQVGPKYSEQQALLEGTPLKILKNMEVTEEWTLNPGDMLYLPPLYAHNGIAVDNCLTLSIGFRSPSETDILQGVCDHVCSEIISPEHYQDPNLKNAEGSAALIDDTAIENFQQLLLKRINDKAALKEWLGEFVTQNKYGHFQEPLEEPLDWEDLQPILSNPENGEGQIIHNEGSRFAYFLNNETAALYINGHPQETTPENQELAMLIANNRQLEIREVACLSNNSASQELLLDLVNQNHLYFEGL